MKEQSEYGKGLIICLVKFAEHSHRWLSDKQINDEMRTKSPDLFSESLAVERHFNGASDHLYEIEVPEKWKRKKLGKLIVELQDFGLEIGHGFTGKTWTESDVTKAYEMCREVALQIDKELGLSPELGEW